jgi:hypothetical protein
MGAYCAVQKETSELNRLAAPGRAQQELVMDWCRVKSWSKLIVPFCTHGGKSGGAN